MTEHTVCKRCVMDSAIVGFKINHLGICNFCSSLDRKLTNLPSLDSRQDMLNELVINIKKRKAKRDSYDCVVGLSGGVDSSWALVQVVELGLNPLVIHFDNGWNSELAQSNILNLIESLNVDYETHVMEWDVYKNMMKAFLAANVVDIELLNDHAIIGYIYKICNERNIKYFISGNNSATEGISMPKNWNWLKIDSRNIKDICRKNGVDVFSNYPFISLSRLIYLALIKKIRYINLLNLLEYKKSHALSELERKYNYKKYYAKHFENVFTRFYQGHILPTKFKIDKRKVHLSSLIISGDISRDQAIQELAKSPYQDTRDLEVDKKYVLSKLEMTEVEFEDYLKSNPVNHANYKNYSLIFTILFGIFQKLRGEDKRERNFEL